MKSLKRDIDEFCLDYPNFEIRDYTKTDLHDRYIISDNYLVISGYSLKDLGKKESFAIFLDVDKNPDTVSSIIDSFHKKWKISVKI